MFKRKLSIRSYKKKLVDDENGTVATITVPVSLINTYWKNVREVNMIFDPHLGRGVLIVAPSEVTDGNQ